MTVIELLTITFVYIVYAVGRRSHVFEVVTRYVYNSPPPEQKMTLWLITVIYLISGVFAAETAVL